MQNTPLALSDVEPERVSDGERGQDTPLSAEVVTQQGFEESERGIEEKETPLTHIEKGDYVMILDEYSAYADRLGQVTQVCGERATVEWLHKPGQPHHYDLADLTLAEMQNFSSSEMTVRSVLGVFKCDFQFNLTKL